jgi:hypothetical protein
VGTTRYVFVTPADGAVIGTPGNGFTVDVDVIPASGSSAAAPAGNALTLTQGSSVATSTSVALVAGGTGTRYRFTLSTVTGIGAGGATLAIGSATAAVTVRVLDGPRAIVLSPADGSVIDALTNSSTVDVQFLPGPGDSFGGPTPGLVTLTQGAATATSTGVSLVSGTTYRFTFTTVTGFGPGTVTVSVSNAWDSDAATATATATIRAVTVPSVVFVSPVASAAGVTLNGSFNVDLEFVVPSGSTLAPPSQTLVTITQGGNTATSNAVSLVSGSTYRFSFAGNAFASFVAGNATITAGAASTVVTVGNAVATSRAVVKSPLVGSVVSPASSITVDVEFFFSSGTFAATPPATNLVTIVQGASTYSAAAAPTLVSGNTYRWTINTTGIRAGGAEIRVGTGWTATAHSAVTAPITFRSVTTATATILPPTGSVLAVPSDTFTVDGLFAQVEGDRLIAPANGIVTLTQGSTSVTSVLATATATPGGYTFSFTGRDFSGFKAGAATITVGGGWSSSVTVAFRAVSATQRAVILPADGAVSSIPVAGFTVDVDLVQVEGTGLTAPSATALTLTQGAKVVTSNSVNPVAGFAGRYRFGFDASALPRFVAGAATIAIGSTSSAVTFRAVVAPTAALVLPATGDAFVTSSLGSFTLDVHLVPSDGATLAAPSAPLLTLTQGSTVIVSSAVALVSGAT